MKTNHPFRLKDLLGMLPFNRGSKRSVFSVVVEEGKDGELEISAYPQIIFDGQKLEQSAATKKRSWQLMDAIYKAAEKQEKISEHKRLTMN